MSEQFDALPCGYVAFNDAGIIVSCNATLTSWLGYTRQELIEGSVEKIMTVASRIFYNTHFFPLIKLRSEANEIFLSLRSKEGKDLPVLANARTEGLAIHCVFILVEERKKFEQELLNAKHEAESSLKENKELIKAKKSLQDQAVELDQQYRNQKIITEGLLQFNKIISHDLQEPIRKIQLFADMIRRNSEGNEKSNNFANKIAASAEKLKSLTLGLQEYIEVDREKLFKIIDLNEVVHTAINKAALTRRYSDFDFVAQELPEIEGYAVQLELLFFHLADNSIKFRHPERRLSIKVASMLLDENVFRHNKERYQYVPHVRIRYTDNGVGFSDKYKNYIFQLLKKVDQSVVGLGLGLPLVKKIVDNHGGEITAESKSGDETSFEILLPLSMIKGSA